MDNRCIKLRTGILPRKQLIDISLTFVASRGLWVFATDVANGPRHRGVKFEANFTPSQEREKFVAYLKRINKEIIHRNYTFQEYKHCEIIKVKIREAPSLPFTRFWWMRR